MAIVLSREAIAVWKAGGEHWSVGGSRIAAEATDATRGLKSKTSQWQHQNLRNGIASIMPLHIEKGPEKVPGLMCQHKRTNQARFDVSKLLGPCEYENEESTTQGPLRSLSV